MYVVVSYSNRSLFITYTLPPPPPPQLVHYAYSYSYYSRSLYTAIPPPPPSASSPPLLTTPLHTSSCLLLLLQVIVSDISEAVPQIDTDESYTLQVGVGDDDGSSSSSSGGGSRAVLKAATVYGALRGLETMSQLVHFDFDEVGGVVG